MNKAHFVNDIKEMIFSGRFVLKCVVADYHDSDNQNMIGLVFQDANSGIEKTIYMNSNDAINVSIENTNHIKKA